MPRQRIAYALLLLFLSLTVLNIVTSPVCAAQEAPTVRTPPPQQIEPPGETPVPANSTETDRYTLSHERYAKAVAYSRAGYTLYFLSVFIGFAVLILALRFHLVARIRDFAQRSSENRPLQGLIFIPLLVSLLDVADLPVHISWHGLSLHYQQSVQGWASWFLDWCKAALIELAFLTLLGLILFLIIRKSPRHWWFYFWLAALPIILGTFILEPVVIDPLFHKFEPLEKQHSELTTDLQKLTQRAGLQIPRERMFLMDASSKTNALNAYVTGFGASKRVVIWDTTIQKMTPQETLFIFGHEAGHYVLNHIRNGFFFFALVLLIALYLAYRLLNGMLDRWGAGWKVYGPQDWGALAVLLLILEGIMFFSSPIINGFSRAEEHAADVFGLELIHGIVPNSAQVAAHAFQALGEQDLADPNPPPFITFWMYSHPPLAERLVFAHGYDPWGKGQPPMYIKSVK
ncbi:MAG TPA: M48 family metallopeptidase [Candidatus Acidoferrum sp.]|jgi:Zn-dependent protease with chaperone function